MKKINQELFIAILDDDPDFAYVLSRLIKKILSTRKLQVYIHVFMTTAEADISPLTFDLLFLDVELGDENGIQWVKKWRRTRKFQDIIVTSSYDHYMIDSMEIRPFAYIRKAHLEQDLQKAMKRYWNESGEEPIYVIVKDGKKEILVDPYHIDYLQANGHYIDIIMDNEEPIVVRNQINELQHILDKYGFVRIQVSYLVNVKFIERVDGKNVYLRNGIKKSISPHFDKIIREKLRSYMETDGEDINGNIC